MSNTSLPSSPVNVASFVHTIQGAADYQHREAERAHMQLGESQSLTKRFRNMLRHGLTAEDWPEYEWLRNAKKFPPAEAASVILNSRRPA